jgi:hypothetical protein
MLAAGTDSSELADPHSARAGWFGPVALDGFGRSQSPRGRSRRLTVLDMTKPSGIRPARAGGRRFAVLLIVSAVIGGLAVAGCVPMKSSSPSAPPAQTSLAPSEPPTAQPSLSAGPITEQPVPEDSQSPAPAKLRTTESVIAGHSGTVSWRVRVPEFSGAPVAAEINKRVRAAVDDLIARAKHESRADNGDRRRLEGEGTVVTNDDRTAQVTITYADYLQGTAHPTNYVTTTVVDVDRGRPIVLKQVFRNPTSAYRKLKPEILKAAGEQASGIDQSGLAPKEANWANWQTNQTGMIFIFEDYQLGGHGLRQYAVPWSALRPLLTGYAKRVLAPQ